MDITIEKQADCTATLKATVPADAVATLKDQIASSYTSHAKIPGFRPGKAPKSVILKRYEAAIEEELVNSLSEQVCDEALTQNPDLKVLDFGKAETATTDNGEFTYSSTLTIVPDFELPEYMGIEVSVASDDVTDADVEDALNQFAQQNAKFETVDRAAAMGDVTVIDFKTTVEGQPTADALGKPVGFLEGREGHWVFMEEDSFMPGLSEGLVGSKAGDTKDITITVPENFPFADLIGKELVFHVSVKEIREKQVPAIDDELFATALPGKTMDEIKDIVRENLKQQKENANNEAKADQISEKLADAIDFELPEALVERESYNVLQRKLYAAMQAGEKEFDGIVDKLREEAKTETRRNLRVYFMLQEVARRENISVTDHEMSNAIMRLAQQEKATNLKSFVKKLQKEGRIPGIRLSLITSKVLDLLVKNAKVTISEAKEETAAAE